MRQISLSKGLYALVDDEDYEYLNQWKWFAYKHVGQNTYYAGRNSTKAEGSKRHTIRMHRVIMNASITEEVDHEDHNGLNNQKYNLRRCTHLENSTNKSRYKNSKSRYKGAHWDKKYSTWTSHIMYKGKSKYLGAFETEELAAHAYDKAAKELHGDYACLNFPEEL